MAAIAESNIRTVAQPTTKVASVWPWVLAAAHLPLVVSYYWRLWSLPHYQFFPLALGAAYFLYRRDQVAAAPPGAAVERRAAGPLFFVGLSLLAAAVALDSPWLAVAAALINGAAWAVDRGGDAALRRLFPAELMVLITLRPPMGLDDRLIRLLQHVTARAASAVLDLLNVTHALSGNVIEIPGRRLLVEEACSGVNSFFSATACVLFYVLWNRRGWISSLLLFLSIPFWVVFANTLRVVTVTTLRAKWDVAADEGLLHDALGLGVFLVAVGLIVSTERLLRFYAVLLERPATAQPPAPAPVGVPPISRHLTIAGVAASALCVLQAPNLWARANHVAAEWRAPPITEFGEAWVPETLGVWRRAKFETVQRDRTSPLGRHSQTWTLGGTNSQIAVSLDYPFVGWHELTDCYEAQGWRTEERLVVSDPAQPEAAAVELAMKHDQSGRHARLLFALVTRDGSPYDVRTRGELDEWRDRAAERWRTLTSFRLPSNPVDDDRLTYQFQIFAESYAPFDEKTRHELRKAFFDLRQKAAARLHADAAAKPR